jgi:hypothetical protein
MGPHHEFRQIGCLPGVSMVAMAESVADETAAWDDGGLMEGCAAQHRGVRCGVMGTDDDYQQRWKRRENDTQPLRLCLPSTGSHRLDWFLMLFIVVVLLVIVI